MALRYLSARPLAPGPHDHVLLCKVKNEALRLPYFLSYYRGLGFDRFVFIDNDSRDGTMELLLAEPDCGVFHTADSFGAAYGGLPWINRLLDDYCDGRWVLAADADEILVWPGSERESIKALTARFDASGAEALFTVMLDLYSDKPFGSIGYRQGAPFIDYLPFFDRGPYRLDKAVLFPHHQVYGGVRARLFRAMQAPIHAPTISKVPLVKWRKGQRFMLSTHALKRPVELAAMRAALLHFKLFDEILDKCRDENAIAEYFEKGREYRVLAQAIAQSRDGSFYDPRLAVRYAGTEHLTRFGIMDRENIFP
ncbi:MAG TPA: glycosyltransferase family 2 protein [Rhizomicrobium sp.]|nr:glycosyltransferase family 2 protein [Rhizomicrobium sp.]